MNLDDYERMAQDLNDVIQKSRELVDYWHALQRDINRLYAAYEQLRSTKQST